MPDSKDRQEKHQKNFNMGYFSLFDASINASAVTITYHRKKPKPSE
jgi:hypothetical protein